MSTRPRIGATVLLGIAAVSGLLLPAASAQGSSRSSSSHSESRRVVVQNGEEETLTDEQLKILMRILACYEPSVFLWLVLTIEIYLNIIVEKLSKLWRQDR